MAAPITFVKGVKVTQVVAANAVPPVELAPRTLEMLDEVQGIQWSKMSVERKKEMLLQQLDLSGLEGLCEVNQSIAQALLVECH